MLDNTYANTLMLWGNGEKVRQMKIILKAFLKEDGRLSTSPLLIANELPKKPSLNLEACRALQSNWEIFVEAKL